MTEIFYGKDGLVMNKKHITDKGWNHATKKGHGYLQKAEFSAKNPEYAETKAEKILATHWQRWGANGR